MAIVVVGAGLAGAHAVEELRKQGHTGPVTLVGAEPHPPYERPPLSKGILLGSDDADSPIVHDAAWYADHDVELLTGTTVSALDLAGRRVRLGDRDLAYDQLLLATGAQPRRLAMADESGADVRYLRTLEDSLALKDRLAAHVLVVGAGWIGLEVASAVRQAGGAATVVESAALPLERVLGPEVAPVFADLHRDHGVDLRLSSGITAVQGDGSGARVTLDDGSVVSPDLVVVGIGAAPDVRLAADAGLAVDDGVLVDARLRTSDPHVLAAGDVAGHDHPLLGHRIRVEHWDTAIQQGKHAARVMLGDDAAYDRQPYFYTDQYDLGMEYVGHTGGGYDDVVLRGDVAGRVFTALWLRGDRVVAGMHVNDWDAIDPLKALVGRPAPSGVRDPEVALGDLVG